MRQQGYGRKRHKKCAGCLQICISLRERYFQYEDQELNGSPVHLSMKNNNATVHNLRTQRKEPRDQSEQKNSLRRDEEIRRNTKKIRQGRQ